MPRRVLILVAALVVAIGAALFVVDPFSGDDQPTETAATSSTAPPATAATTTTTLDPAVACDPGRFDPDEMESLLDVTVPLGFVQQADAVRNTGPTDFEAAVVVEDEPDAREALTSVRFLRGYQRYWVNRADVELVGFVYEFCESSGATDYAARYARLVSASGLGPFTPEGIEGAAGHSGRGDRTAALVSAARGRYVVAAVAGSGGAVLSVDDVEALTTGLAAALLEKLPQPPE